MKKSLLLLASLLLCLTFAAPALSQRNKTGCGSDVPLAVTVTDIAPDYLNNRGSIVSDGGAEYVNGGGRGNKITAIFQVDNCSQDFTLNLNFSTRYLLANLPDGRSIKSQFFNFDRVASVPVTPTTYAESQAFLSSQFCTAVPTPMGGFVVGKNFDGSYQDNYAGCAVDADGKAYVKRNVGFTLYENPDNDHRLRFQFSPLDSPNGNPDVVGTAYIKVYHPTANTWELVPDNVNENGMVVGEVSVLRTYAGGTYVYAGNPIMPFRITVRKL